MQPFPLEFTIDSSGSPDVLTLPQDFPSGECTLRLKPPAGHAWTFYGQGTEVFELDLDEVLTIGPGYRYAGETIGSAELDTGTGTLRGIAS